MWWTYLYTISCGFIKLWGCTTKPSSLGLELLSMFEWVYLFVCSKPLTIRIPPLTSHILNLLPIHPIARQNVFTWQLTRTTPLEQWQPHPTHSFPTLLPPTPFTIPNPFPAPPFRERRPSDLRTGAWKCYAYALCCLAIGCWHALAYPLPRHIVHRLF